MSESHSATASSIAPDPDDDPAGLAVSCLAAGFPVGVPTETVYGLAADALNPEAVQRIFAMKGRPSANPLSCLVDSAAMGRCWLASSWPAVADALADAFWPGPLTLVLPRQDGIPDIVTGGQPTIGIRVPDQDLTRSVIRRFGRPVAAPSANRSGDASPVTADDVRRAFADHPDLLVLDGGRCRGGVESTVVRIESADDDPVAGSGGPTVVRVLRPGMLSVTQLQEVVGDLGVVVAAVAGGATGTAGPTRSGESGVFRFDRAAWERLRTELTAEDVVIVIGDHPDPSGMTAARVALLPGDDVGCGREFYSAFHTAKADGRRVFIEWPADARHPDGSWPAIRHRIERLSALWNPADA